MCTNNIMAQQWREQFLKFSTIDRGKIFCFTSIEKNLIGEEQVVISTYSMISQKEESRGQLGQQNNDLI